MSSIRIEISSQLPSSDIDALQQELKSLATVEKPQSQNFDFGAMVLVVSFVAGGIQTADILVKWLKNIKPRGNQILLRLSDGRTLSMEANTDPEHFLRQLKAALREL